MVCEDAPGTSRSTDVHTWRPGTAQGWTLVAPASGNRSRAGDTVGQRRPGPNARRAGAGCTCTDAQGGGSTCRLGQAVISKGGVAYTHHCCATCATRHARERPVLHTCMLWGARSRLVRVHRPMCVRQQPVWGGGREGAKDGRGETTRLRPRTSQTAPCRSAPG